ncbi:hypothetical protein C6497_08920 [Candidatus Poribacteria bacterium]|nr:MAG: hypothetical protein C6497_08920 [Candidatus Poribacteria bacterium]
MLLLTLKKLSTLNLFSILIYLLIYITIFTTIATVVDDSFARSTYKDFTEDISRSFNNLPWSLWRIVLALSDIVKEIVSEFSFNILSFAIPPTLVAYYCSYRGRKKGKKTEREIWMQWYEKMKNDNVPLDTNTLPILSGSILKNSHFKRISDAVIQIGRSPVILVHHFVYHLFAFSILLIIRSIPISIGIEVYFLYVVFFFSIICTLISAFIEGNSIINGTNAERFVWTKWYFANYGYISQVKQLPEPPNSIQGNTYSIITRLKTTGILIFHQPISILLHLVFWIISCHIIYSRSLGYWISIRSDRIGRLMFEYSICAIIITLIIMYRKAKGRQKGRALEQDKCMNKYSDIFQQLSTIKIKKDRYSTFDSNHQYFLTLQEAVNVVFRKPQVLIYHFVGWTVTLVLLYGFTDWLLLERLIKFLQLSVVIILTFITCILETQQHIIGIVNQRQKWTNWHHRFIEVKNDDLSFTELPPIID